MTRHRQSAHAALAFLTPVGGVSPPQPAALTWFPPVGAAVGLALGGVWWAGGRIWPPGVAAAVVVVADLGLTGMLHLDGLVDTADGLLPAFERERRLEVMADARAGAFGVGAAAAVLLLRWSALTSMTPQPLLLAGVWCASRTAMAVVVRTVPYARASGLAAPFLPSGPADAAAGASGSNGVLPLIGAVASAALAGAARGKVGVAAVAGLGVTAAGVTALARRRLGGFTGDVLGAAGMVGETVALTVAAAKW